MDLLQIMSKAKELGFNGAEATVWVEKMYKEESARERQRRVDEREAKAEEYERQRKIREEEHKIKEEEDERQRKIKEEEHKARVEEDERKRGIIEEEQRAFIERHQLEMELAKVKKSSQDNESHMARRPKLPCFDGKADEKDSYLHRYEH